MVGSLDAGIPISPDLMLALSFDTLILGGAASCVPHAIFNYFLDSAVTAIGRPHGEIGVDRPAPYSFVSSLSPATGWAVFELAPVMEKLLDHLVGAAGNIATDRSKVDNLTDVEFVRGRRPIRPSSAFILARLCDRRVAPPRSEPETPLISLYQRHTGL
jgi:hypothetical protein